MTAEQRAEYETHYDIHSDPTWIALHMPTCRKACQPYSKTIADLITLFMDACRILDESDLIGTGNTEEEAIEAARIAAKQP